MAFVNLPPSPVTCRNLVGGQWEDSSGPLLLVRSPYTGGVIGQVPMTPATEVSRIVAAAAHHLGFRVRGWNENHHLISNLPEPDISVKEGLRKGCWTVHPVKF